MKNKLFVYPKANASLKVVGDFMIFYLGIDGDLQQNSYRDFTNENPFVSPTLAIAPTDRQFDVYAGLKGKLANSVSYTVRGSVINEKNKALFIANNYNESIVIQEMYQYGNSFGLTYDTLRTFRFFGELKADFTKNIAVGVNATFNTYSQENEKEAWNLPQFQLGANIDATITSKWFAGANLFFVGDRKDKQINFDVPTAGLKTVKSYFDAIPQHEIIPPSFEEESNFGILKQLWDWVAGFLPSSVTAYVKTHYKSAKTKGSW